MEYPITIKTTTGQTHIIQVSESTTVLELKQKYSDITSVEVDSFKLIHNAKQLDNDKNMQFYNIKASSLLYLVLILKKPVILLYNYQKDTNVEVSLKLNKGINFSSVYPRPKAFTNKADRLTWNVTFVENGKIKLEDNQRYYPYLFYECDCVNFVDENEMHNFTCVSSEDVEDKLDKVLEKMGLNYAERCDMITYWLPQLTEKKYVNFGFVKNEAYEKIVNLTVNPPPEVLIRVIMVFKCIDEFDKECPKELDYVPQINEDSTIQKVVEWGAIKFI